MLESIDKSLVTRAEYSAKVFLDIGFRPGLHSTSLICYLHSCVTNILPTPLPSALSTDLDHYGHFYDPTHFIYNTDNPCAATSHCKRKTSDETRISSTIRTPNLGYSNNIHIDSEITFILLYLKLNQNAIRLNTIRPHPTESSEQRPLPELCHYISNVVMTEQDCGSVSILTDFSEEAIAFSPAASSLFSIPELSHDTSPDRSPPGAYLLRHIEGC